MGISLQIYRKCNKKCFQHLDAYKKPIVTDSPTLNPIKQLKPTAGMAIKLIKKLKTIKHLKNQSNAL